MTAAAMARARILCTCAASAIIAAINRVPSGSSNPLARTTDALQGKRCWLGVSLPVAMRWGVRSSCSQPCSGDPQRVCGGAAPTEFSLYRTDTCPEGEDEQPEVYDRCCWYEFTLLMAISS